MATYSTEPQYEKDIEKKAVDSPQISEYDVQTEEPRELKRHLQNRHMQMIAIGGAIGAGYFVSSGGALSTGGPASLVIGFMIVGLMLLVTMQALAEMAVLYPVNGAFYSYAVRFIDPSWGFATGWQYAIQWLTILPFEITAATITISFWETGANTNAAVWVTVFLVALVAVQVFGVRGFGEVEFVLSIIKVTATVGFIILAIIIDCGGVPTQPRFADGSKYIGARYWYDPGAFNNGFQGFCTVFVTAAFAFSGTELTGLAAAESSNPAKAIPKATKQVFWRILIFYVIGLFLVGLLVPYTDDRLLNSGGANTKYSPFVMAIQDAGIQALPSIFNAVITISVLSVANSSAYASTRTMQALGKTGMGPKFLAYVDKGGRPLWCVLIQIAFGFLAYVIEAGPMVKNQFFYWLLSLSGLSSFFIWGSICLSHIRFRQGWKSAGRTLDEIPYLAFFGVWGSAFGLLLNILCLIATFYVSLYPPGGPYLDPTNFFQGYLAAPLIIMLYLIWKVISRDPKLYIRAHEMDVTTGLRANLDELRHEREAKPPLTLKNAPLRVAQFLF